LEIEVNIIINHVNMLQQTAGDTCELTSSGQLHKKLKHSEEILESNLNKFSKDIYCDKHTDKCQQFFCIECQVAVCIECWDQLHRAHKFSDINSVTRELQRQMETDFCNLTDGADHCREVLQSITEKRKELCVQIAKADDDICRTADHLQHLIEQHKRQALTSLASAKQAHMQEADSLYSGVEQQLSMIENMKLCTKEMASEGNASSMVCEITAMHSQAEKLLKFDAVQSALQNLNSIDISFAASETMAKGSSNVVGTINDVSSVHSESILTG
jgi:B-box zinc finger